MCLIDLKSSAKARRLKQVGYICLAAGLLLANFARTSATVAQNWLHATSGFLLGFSIVALLAGVRMSRRNA